MRYSRRIAAFILLVGMLAFAPAASAQSAIALGPADTSSPQATLSSFIDSCNQLYQEVKDRRYLQRENPRFRHLARRVLDCLDDSELPQYARLHGRAEAAVCLKEILDRLEVPPLAEIPDADAIQAMDEPLARWQVPGSRLVIVRMLEGPRKHEYLFSAGTVKRSFEYYQDIRDVPYRESGPAVSPGMYRWYLTAPSTPSVGWIVAQLPEAMRTQSYGLARWKWAGLVLATLICLAILALLYRLQQRLAVRYRREKPLAYAATILVPILAALTPLLFRYLVTHVVSLRGDWLYVSSFAASVATLIACVVLVFAVIDRLSAVLIGMPHINPKGLDAQFIRIVARLLSLAAAVVVFLEGGKYLGIPITTLLASAGVGGVAVALAAQDMLKNLFGTIMLMADKPFRVGDRIVSDGYDGVVEEIGLRSTRVRLLNGHLVTMPNDTLSRNDVENIARRPFIRRVTDLRIPLTTPKAKVDRVLAILRGILEGHEGMDPSYPPRVFFNEVNDDSLNVRVMYWYHPAEYWDYLAFSERVNLEFLAALESQGIPLSQPLRVSHAGLDNEPAAVTVAMASSS